MGTLCAACFITTLIPSFDQPTYRPVRAIMFMAAGLSTAAVFVAILCFKNEFKLETDPGWYGVGGYVYIQGAVLYVLRVPERCKPGAFDLCGASH